MSRITHTAAAPDTLGRKPRGIDLTGYATEEFADRFWSKVDPTGDCWLWTAYCKPQGYGQFTLRKGQFYGAHTISYALAKGPVLPGQVVCHHCDNPPCVNPDHLFLGTQQDNVRDMFKKGRAPRTHGTDRHNARLTESAVKEIKNAVERRGLQTELANFYGVSTTTIRKIRAGQKWSHIK